MFIKSIFIIYHDVITCNSWIFKSAISIYNIYSSSLNCAIYAKIDNISVLKFCISHGSVDGLKYDQYEDQVWKGCEVSYDNDVRICKIKFPYWAYYILGKGNDPEIGAELEVYYMSYSYLKQKQEEGVALSTDELIFMNDLYEILSERLPEAKENYILEVQVEVNDTHTFFIQNLHLSDICK